MKQISKIFLTLTAVACFTAVAVAQDSSSATMRRGSRNRDKQENSQVSTRLQNRMQTPAVSDADLSWMKVIYRSLDLTKDKNAPLYFPEEPTEGSESLFRIVMRLLADGQLPVYEYLDGREVFTDQYRLKVRDILDRFHIYYQDAKGSTEKNPKFTIHESDVPASEVLSYYILERWEFDTRDNRMRTRIEAICPVLHRSDDFGMETVKYPMFWIKYSDLRPYLSTQNIFVSDYNNLPSCTYDDYFTLNLYEGDIYKTRNLRNRSMMQLHPDPDDMKRAQDSIQKELDTFEKKLWVPDLEELQARREAKERAEAEAAAKASGDSISVAPADKEKSGRRVVSRRGSKSKSAASKPAKVKRAKAPKTKWAATRSVRNRKR